MRVLIFLTLIWTIRARTTSDQYEALPKFNGIVNSKEDHGRTPPIFIPSEYYDSTERSFRKGICEKSKQSIVDKEDETGLNHIEYDDGEENVNVNKNEVNHCPGCHAAATTKHDEIYTDDTNRNEIGPNLVALKARQLYAKTPYRTLNDYDEEGKMATVGRGNFKSQKNLSVNRKVYQTFDVTKSYESPMTRGYGDTALGVDRLYDVEEFDDQEFEVGTSYFKLTTAETKRRVETPRTPFYSFRTPEEGKGTIRISVEVEEARKRKYGGLKEQIHPPPILTLGSGSNSKTMSSDQYPCMANCPQYPCGVCIQPFYPVQTMCPCQMSPGKSSTTNSACLHSTTCGCTEQGSTKTRRTKSPNRRCTTKCPRTIASHTLEGCFWKPVMTCPSNFYHQCTHPQREMDWQDADIGPQERKPMERTRSEKSTTIFDGPTSYRTTFASSTHASSTVSSIPSTTKEHSKKVFTQTELVPDEKILKSFGKAIINIQSALNMAKAEFRRYSMGKKSHLRKSCHKRRYNRAVTNKLGTTSLKEELDDQGDWGAWSAWSPCSVTCGKGIQKRTRSKKNGGGPDIKQTEERVCRLANCRPDFSLLIHEVLKGTVKPY